MTKLVLDDVGSGYNLSILNNNFQKISQELQENVLYRKNPAGEPNQMEGNLDLNSNKLLNVGEGEVDSDGVNIKQVKEILGNTGVSGGSIISETPPSIALDGQRWTRCADMVSFIWYEDEDGGQWVEDNRIVTGKQ